MPKPRSTDIFLVAKPLLPPVNHCRIPAEMLLKQQEGKLQFVVAKNL